MKILNAYVKVFDDEIEGEPVSDVLCKILTISQETFMQGSGEYATTETYQCAYVLNPETGEVQRVRLVDIIINTFEDENKSIITCSNPARVGEGISDQKWDNNPINGKNRS